MDKSVVIGLGMFDGVHLAHQVLIRKVGEVAKQVGLPGCIYLFTNHPHAVLSGRHPGLLTTLEEKTAMIRRLGVEQIRLEEFTPSFARKTPEEFADYLARDLHAHSLVAGFNYSFAHQGMGDCVLLAKLCRERDMGLYVIPPVKVGDTVVSSTAVRQALAAGALERANQLLGYEYSLSGEITDGRKVGRNIGYPTANLTLTEPKVLPPNGVYLTRLRLGDEVFRAVTNIGVRPTFDDADSITIETFIPGFNGNLYGRDARLSLVRFLRHEQRFSCMDELKKQIAQDVLIATEYFRHEQPPVSPY